MCKWTWDLCIVQFFALVLAGANVTTSPVENRACNRQPTWYDIASNMKTTIDIAQSLLSAAKRAAAREDTTVRALVEEGLRRALAERQTKAGEPFRLRRASFAGEGLRPELAEGGWDRLRDLSYEGRGA